MNIAMPEATVSQLWRWPVKGLGGQTLGTVDLEPGRLFPWDRAFALENGPSDFDADNPQHVSKRQFVCMVHQADTGRMSANYSEATGLLTITTLDGQTLSIDPARPGALERLAENMVQEGVRGPLRLRNASDSSLGHGFTDVPGRWISIQNQASIQALETASGARVDPRRLRANVLLAGWSAFDEETLIGQTLKLGAAEVQVTEVINRCRAIDVNPDTAFHDRDLVRTLVGMRGKRSLGLYAQVTKAGRLAPGDHASVLELL